MHESIISEIPSCVVEAIKMYKNGCTLSMAALKCKTSRALIKYWLRHEENQGKKNAKANPGDSITVSNNVNDLEFHKNKSTNVDISLKMEPVIAEVKKEDSENQKVNSVQNEIVHKNEATMENSALNINIKNEKVEFLIKDKENSLLNRKIYENSVNLNAKLEAVEMYENDKTLKDIWSEYNVCPTTVHKWVKYKKNAKDL